MANLFNHSNFNIQEGVFGIDHELKNSCCCGVFGGKNYGMESSMIDGLVFASERLALRLNIADGSLLWSIPNGINEVINAAFFVIFYSK